MAPQSEWPQRMACFTLSTSTAYSIVAVHAVDIVAGNGHDVAGVARNEEIAGAGAEDQIGDNARVGTGDEEDIPAPASRPANGIDLPPRGKTFREKLLVSLNQPIHLDPSTCRYLAQDGLPCDQPIASRSG